MNWSTNRWVKKLVTSWQMFLPTEFPQSMNEVNQLQAASQIPKSRTFAMIYGTSRKMVVWQKIDTLLTYNRFSFLRFEYLVLPSEWKCKHDKQKSQQKPPIWRRKRKICVLTKLLNVEKWFQFWLLILFSQLIYVSRVKEEASRYMRCRSDNQRSERINAAGCGSELYFPLIWCMYEEGIRENVGGGDTVEYCEESDESTTLNGVPEIKAAGEAWGGLQAGEENLLPANLSMFSDPTDYLRVSILDSVRICRCWWNLGFRNSLLHLYFLFFFFFFFRVGCWKIP